MSILKIETGIKTMKIVGLVKKMYLNCLIPIDHSQLFLYILQYYIYNIMSWNTAVFSFVILMEKCYYKCLFLFLSI